MRKVQLHSIAKLLVVIIIVSLIPFSALKSPENQAFIKGLDTELIDFNRPEGVSVDNDTLTLTANPGIVPFVTTITTPASFVVCFNGTVQQEKGSALPLQAGIWDTITSDTFSVWLASPENTIEYGTRRSFDNWETKSEIGKYVVGNSYMFQITFVPNSYVEMAISNSTWSNTTRLENATILSRPMVSFSFFATAGEAESVSRIEQYSVTIPAQGYFSYFTDFLGSWLNILYVALVVAIIVLWRSELVNAFRQAKHFVYAVVDHLKAQGREKWVILIAAATSVLVQIYLTTMGSHPYDIFTQKTWSYIITGYGPRNLYPMSLILPTGRAVGSVSIIDFIYPYPPLFGYIYALDGFVNWLLVPKVTLTSSSFDFLVKLPWIMAVVVLGLVVYYYMKTVVGQNSAFILAVLILFNPGVLINSAVWGQSEVVLAIFLSLALVATIKGSVQKTWLLLILSILSKQTVIVAVVFVFLLTLQRFGIRKIIRGLTFPFVLVFLIISPWLFLGYSPSFFFNVSIGEHVLNVLAGSKGVAAWQNPVSGGVHNIWPIITSKLNLESGWTRFTFPDSLPNQIFGISYSNLGLYLTIASFMFIILQVIITQKRKTMSDDHYCFFILYLVTLSTTVLMTRMSPRYLLLPLSFLLFAYPWIRSKTLFGILFGSLSLSFFLSIYSNLVLTAFQQPPNLPNFYPTFNSFNQTMFRFIMNDYWISALSFLILGLLVFSLAFSAIRLFSHNKSARLSQSKTDYDSRAMSTPKRSEGIRESGSVDAPLVSVIILNHNGLSFLRNCVLSVLSSRFESLEVVVVDNASTDLSLGSIQDLTRDSRLRTIGLEQNMGFSRGNNVGADRARGKYLIFLNNDVIVSEDWLEPIVDALERDEAMGAAQPKLMFLDRPDEVQSAGNRIDRFAFTIPRARLRDDFGEPRSDIAANGAALAIRRDLFNRIGGFEPSFFIYYEDADLSWRVYLAGKYVQYVPSSIVYHKEGAVMSRKKLQTRLTQLVRNQLFTAFKDYSLKRGLICISFLFLLYIAGSIWFIFRKSSEISLSILKALFQFLQVFPRCWESHIFVQRRVRKVSDERILSCFLKSFNPFLLFAFYRTGMGYVTIDYGKPVNSKIRSFGYEHSDPFEFSPAS